MEIPRPGIRRAALDLLFYDKIGHIANGFEGVFPRIFKQGSGFLSSRQRRRDRILLSSSGFLECSFQIFVVRSLGTRQAANAVGQNKIDAAFSKRFNDVGLAARIFLKGVEHLDVLRLRERSYLRKCGLNNTKNYEYKN